MILVGVLKDPSRRVPADPGRRLHRHRRQWGMATHMRWGCCPDQAVLTNTGAATSSEGAALRVTAILATTVVALGWRDCCRPKSRPFYFGFS